METTAILSYKPILPYKTNDVQNIQHLLKSKCATSNRYSWVNGYLLQPSLKLRRQVAVQQVLSRWYRAVFQSSVSHLM